MNSKTARLLRQYSESLGFPPEKIKQAFDQLDPVQQIESLMKIKQHLQRQRTT